MAELVAITALKATRACDKRPEMIVFMGFKKNNNKKQINKKQKNKQKNTSHTSPKAKQKTSQKQNSGYLN